jgi:serine phosphatase RsbU (regulator of sigma subunit)
LNNELEEKVKLRTKELELSNDRFKDSIEYASFIQKSMLPQEEEIENSLLKTFIYHKPLQKVSGDYYWYGVNPSNEDLEIIALLDCTGHGVPGALLSMIGDLLMNDIIYNKQVTDPKEVLLLLNEGVQSILNQDKNGNRDGMDVAVVIIDKSKKSLSFAGARQELMIFRNNKQSIEKGVKFGIGGNFELDIVFETKEISLEGVDSFYLYSDGYKDQFGGDNSKKFSKSSFEKLLKSISNKEQNQQKLLLEEKFKDWKGNEDQTDDVLVMGFELKKENN